MIKYLGSKRLLLPSILNAVKGLADPGAVILDLFSGTARVGHALKGAQYRVYSNDCNLYAYHLARCYVEANLEAVEGRARVLIKELNALKGSEGYFTQKFCKEALFFHPKNGERVDAIREVLASKGLDPILESVMLVSLMEAADRVDATCGIQMSYLKKYPARALQDLELRMPNVQPAVSGPCQAYCRDAMELVDEVQVDVAYLDPPYNQHSYYSNYHIWESLVRWDKPETYGKAKKRVDCQTSKSPFNFKTKCREAFESLINRVQAKNLVVSFSNEGFISRSEMENLLSKKGEVSVETLNYKRYVGAQIGIYNPKGQSVGEVSHLYNKEFLYIVRP